MLAALVACFMVLTGITGARAATFQNYTCVGGTATSPQVIPPGDYGALTIRGVCIVEGVVTAHGNATLSSNAALYVFDQGAILNVLGSMVVGPNAVLVLGCLNDFGCPTSNTVQGNLVAYNALAVLLHSDVVGGGIYFQGGGGGVNCNSNPLLMGAPSYSTIENSTVGGGVNVLAMQSCWFGLFRNQVKLNVTVDYNTFADPDATEIAGNTVGGNLSCFGNNPAAQFGDGPPVPNTVAGNKYGECATL